MSEDIWEPYKNLLGTEIIDQLYQIADLLKGVKIVHVNSTKVGGGVAEILTKLVPLSNALGLNTEWLVMKGTNDFFQCTKMFHNIFQGRGRALPNATLLKAYEETNAQNAKEFAPILQEADIVFIHDPQPLPFIANIQKKKDAKWIWRCHIEVTPASRLVWKYLKKYVSNYDATIFSLEDFVQPLPHPTFLIPPSIDPFSEKNIELDQAEIEQVMRQFGIDPKRPVVLQASRFDIFKDPIGVVGAYKLAKKFNPTLQLILAGGGADDDPEAGAVLHEVMESSKDDPDIHILNLPPNARVINALQRGADIVLQKSVREGFGLTVTEALWKSKPVIGGNTGGIRLQLINHYTGYLVNTPEGAANRIRYLLQNPEKGKQLGTAGKHHVKENFLITRHLREYLTVMASLRRATGSRVDLSRRITPPK